MKLKKQNINCIKDIELHRMSTLNYMLIDYSNNREGIFLNFLHSDSREEQLVKRNEALKYLLSKR